MTWNIRPARAADLPAIVAIYNSTIESRASTADLAPVSVASRQAWFAAHHGNRPLYVAEDADGTVCAWGSFSDYYPRAAYRISAEISIYIAPERRGNGLGRKLLQEMLQRAPHSASKTSLPSSSRITRRVLRCFSRRDSSNGGDCCLEHSWVFCS